MTIASSHNKHVYIGNGATTKWPFTFAIQKQDEVNVYITDNLNQVSKLTTGYTVDINQKEVAYPLSGSPLASGWKITILRNVALMQELDLNNQGAFFAKSIEQALDKVTMALQQHNEMIGRSVQLPVDNTGGGDQLIGEILSSVSVAKAAASQAVGAAAAAAVSQDGAAASAVIAAGAKDIAVSSASSASYSSDSAGLSATAAASSASSASTSATNAANSASAAWTSAVAASNAVSNAVVSETNAANSASAAIAKATEAANSATVASNAAAQLTNVNSAIGLTNYISEGLKLSPGAGLSINIGPGRANITEKVVQLAMLKGLLLDPRMVAIVYLKNDGTIGKVNASLPAVDTNTVALWDFSKWDGVSPIPNSAVGVNGNTIAVVNNLTKSGTVTRVDGHVGYAAQGDGSTGHMASGNSTGFPVGNADRGLTFLYTHKTGTVQTLCGYGATGEGQGCYLQIAGDTLNYGDNTTAPSTSYTFENGRTYEIEFGVDTGKVLVYVSGTPVFSTPGVFSTVAGSAYVFRHPSGYASGGTIHYFELRTKMRTPEQIAQISNALLLPCSYQTQYQEEFINGMKYYDIANSENAISGGDAVSYPKGNAFSKDGSATLWVSSQTGAGVNGVSYIGQKVSSNIKKIRYLSQAANTTPNVKIQWSYNGLTGWTDIQIQSLPATASTTTEFYVASYLATSSHYVRLLANSVLTQSWNISELNMFTDVKPSQIQDVCSIIPADSISLGYVKTSSTAVTEIDDSSYKYGRREGATGGNRKVFLGWKYFSGATTLTWDNPFGTRKVKTYCVWAQDASGTNESFVPSWFVSNATDFGVRTSPSASPRISASIGSGGAISFGGWQTTGYIGCYAEVLDGD